MIYKPPLFSNKVLFIHLKLCLDLIWIFILKHDNDPLLFLLHLSFQPVYTTLQTSCTFFPTCVLHWVSPLRNSHVFFRHLIPSSGVNRPVTGGLCARCFLMQINLLDSMSVLSFTAFLFFPADKSSALSSDKETRYLIVPRWMAWGTRCSDLQFSILPTLEFTGSVSTSEIKLQDKCCRICEGEIWLKSVWYSFFSLDFTVISWPLVRLSC